ncbi:dihydrofolate reductase-like domain-containing protein [Mortierella sp. GBAus27b]|nr:dihydrofolate reductase [Mortierella sp. GBA43]KAI8345469.1 dihydrofolate reductase-like domain-containing protein [Mortierella sp. GBAus27b]
MVSFSIVVAADLNNGIGVNGTLPWRLKKDMAFFARITSKLVDSATTLPATTATRVNACIMGRRTWESIPPKFRPLTSRFNVIVTRDPKYLDDKPEKDNPLVAVATSFESALSLVESLQHSSPSEPRSDPATEQSTSAVQVERVFLIGGAQLYEEGVRSSDCTNIFLTRIQSTFQCDTFFPPIRTDQYQLLPSLESHAFLENFLQEPVQGGIIEEGEGDKRVSYEYTVYNRI